MEHNRNSWAPGTPVEANAYNWGGEPVLMPPLEPDNNTDKPTVVDLFCGCGGFSVGFGWAGLEPILGVDIHPPSLDTYRHNHARAAVVLGDMRRVSERQIASAISQSVDVLAAGVPCQGFSLNNRKRWDEDERNFLFQEFVRTARVLKPRIVVLENVSGLRYSANGAFKAAIAEAIEQLGYRVFFRQLDASDFGVPQFRRRVFFVGVSEDMQMGWPVPTHGQGRRQSRVSVWDAIGDLPQLEPGGVADRYDSPPFSDYQRFLRCDQEVLHNHIAPKHPEATVVKIAATRPGEPIYKRFKQRIRLHPERPSPTQVSGGIRAQYQFGHPNSPRGLTVRERCRIQSFPDAFEIHGGTVQGRVQTGNAVPPLLAMALGRELTRMLRGEARSEMTEAPGPRQLALL